MTFVTVKGRVGTEMQEGGQQIVDDDRPSGMNPEENQDATIVASSPESSFSRVTPEERYALLLPMMESAIACDAHLKGKPTSPYTGSCFAFVSYFMKLGATEEASQVLYKIGLDGSVEEAFVAAEFLHEMGKSDLAIEVLAHMHQKLLDAAYESADEMGNAVFDESATDVLLRIADRNVAYGGKPNASAEIYLEVISCGTQPMEAAYQLRELGQAEAACHAIFSLITRQADKLKTSAAFFLPAAEFLSEHGKRDQAIAAYELFGMTGNEPLEAVKALHRLGETTKAREILQHMITVRGIEPTQPEIAEWLKKTSSQ